MADEIKKRIHDQLRKAGVSKYSIRKNEVRYLVTIIHEDETIGAAINGRSEVGSVMLVATDRRVIYLDCKSFYTTVDELTYDVVSGVNFHIQGTFANVTLHTRIGEYHMRIVNPKSAEHFVNFIEAKRLEQPDDRTKKTSVSRIAMPAKSIRLDKQASNFLMTHNLGVISTIDRTGNIHGAAVYYVADENSLYFLTKSETQKARDLLVNNQVAFTIVEELQYQTLQLRGYAEVVSGEDVRMRVFNSILKLRNLEDQTTLPPITSIQEGSYVVFHVLISEANYSNFKK